MLTIAQEQSFRFRQDPTPKFDPKNLSSLKHQEVT